ncbi:MAG: MW1434 family type I TA system toxin [Rikenellaceae bacterium]
MYLRYVDLYGDKYYLIKENGKIDGTFHPFIAMKTADNHFVPWLASQTDILSEDWMVI